MATDTTLRGLLGQYLSHPDPEAWLAAGDYFEERGDMEQAELWRLRARHFGTIENAISAVLGDVIGRNVEVGNWSIWFGRRNKSVRLRRFRFKGEQVRPDGFGTYGTREARILAFMYLEGMRWRIKSLTENRSHRTRKVLSLIGCLAYHERALSGK
jgi:hypothetical protein